MAEINQRRVEQQLRNFERALQAYGHDEPLSRFLTRFFKENRQMGSADRRMTSRYCYNYFRLGEAVKAISLQEKLVIAEFLCEQASDVVALHQPSWLAAITAPLADKVALLQDQSITVKDAIFPFQQHLSPDVLVEDFVLSHLIQPDLFIRVQQQATEQVEAELQRAAISFLSIGKAGYRLPNGSKLQELKGIAGLYEVQDQSSQQSLDMAQLQPGQSWWDACAASGGKSLLLLEKEPAVRLLVSDIRLSILRNLDERFQVAKVKAAYRKKVLDLTEDVGHIMQGERFDGIILDAPCSGSGTWSRTPEMIKQFSETKIAEFSDLQKRIAKQVSSYLKPNGQLIYITCSVFQEENEAVVAFLEASCGLKVETQQLIAGYNRKSDSMFAARLRKI